MTAWIERRPDLDWRRGAVLLLAAAVVATALFAFTPLDIDAARVFYHPHSLDHWPLASRMPWVALYRAAPWMTAGLLIWGFAALARGIAKHDDTLRRHGVVILLSVVLGPGLLANFVLKDHWDRPRPRDVIELGGQMPYVPAPLRGEGGASFPCGHCTVGFLYAAGWWLWRRRRRAGAAASLAAGVLAGSAVGLERMVAGGHFLSDIVWSALIVFGVTHAVYHWVFRFHNPSRRPLQEASTAVDTRADRALIALAVAAACVVFIELFVAPHGEPFNEVVPLGSLPTPPLVFQVTARRANVDITLVDQPAATASATGELHGFGIPGGRLSATFHFLSHPVPTLEFPIDERGWFTDLSAVSDIRLPVAHFKRIEVRVGHGDILVTDATGRGLLKAGGPGGLQLDLRTRHGTHVVVAPPACQGK
ncbi:MAG: phosphatase PAP2 family protein [Steroidobacteraceae bacterium]